MTKELPSKRYIGKGFMVEYDRESGYIFFSDGKELSPQEKVNAVAEVYRLLAVAYLDSRLDDRFVVAFGVYKHQEAALFDKCGFVSWFDKRERGTGYVHSDGKRVFYFSDFISDIVPLFTSAAA